MAIEARTAQRLMALAKQSNTFKCGACAAFEPCACGRSARSSDGGKTAFAKLAASGWKLQSAHRAGAKGGVNSKTVAGHVPVDASSRAAQPPEAIIGIIEAACFEPPAARGRKRGPRRRH